MSRKLKVVVDSDGYLVYRFFIWDREYRKSVAMRVTDDVVMAALEHQEGES